MKIGILQAGHAPQKMIDETGDYGDIFKNFLSKEDFKFCVYSVVDMEFPNSANDADAWLITGSRHGVYEPLTFIKPLEALVREFHAKRIPLAGVCFGHQLIAQALGGVVENFEGGWCIGHTEYELQNKRITLNAWHQDQIVKLPKEAVVIGSSSFCKYAFLKYGQHILTVQAHPEFNGNFIEGLIKFRGPGVIPTHLLERAREKIHLSNHSDVIQKQIVGLFQSAMVKA